MKTLEVKEMEKIQGGNQYRKDRRRQRKQNKKNGRP